MNQEERIKSEVAKIIAKELLLPLEAKSEYGKGAELGLKHVKLVMVVEQIMAYLYSQGVKF